MHTYRLKLPDDGTSCAREIEFEASDGLQALSIAHQHAQHRPAELWCDGSIICVIEEAAYGFWQIGPVRDRALTDGSGGREKSAAERTPSAAGRRPRLHLNLR